MQLFGQVTPAPLGSAWCFTLCEDCVKQDTICCTPQEEFGSSCMHLGPTEKAMRGPLQCFECGGDHLARDCPLQNLQTKGNGKGTNFVECFTCGGAHLARECPERGRGKSMGKGLECFNCGGHHYARDCPDMGKGRGKGRGGVKGSYGGKSVCIDFRDNGICRFGIECRFAHDT